MGSYAVRRLVAAVPVLVGAILVAFFMVRLIPGDPAAVIAGEQATRETIEAIRHELGLDQPWPVQLGLYLVRLGRGDLGRSAHTQAPVITEIAARFPFTVALAVAAMLLATVGAIPAGVLSATRKDSAWDYTVMFSALLGVSMPVFWLGLLLTLAFSVALPWFPAGGAGSLRHLVLPSVTLAAPSLALLARMTRSSMLEVLRQDYVRTARAKGLPERIVIYRHALKNALIPVITTMGLQLGTLLAGAVLTESVFAWPGLGRLMVASILTRDYPLVQGTVLVLAVTFVIVNLVVDLSYSLVDPRIRYR